MTSFVEQENERRSQERSKLLVPAELSTPDHKETIVVMDLSQNSCRAVVSTKKLSDRVTIALKLPEQGTVPVLARVSWSKELSPGRYHVTFGDFEFSGPGQEQALRSYLNEITVANEEMGVTALRELGNDEIQRLSRMVRASRSLNSSQHYLEALEQVVDVTRHALGAERGLFLVDRGDLNLVVEVARGGDALAQRGLQFSMTVANQVAESGTPLLSLDAQTDQALGAVTSIKLLGTVSVMCVPLRTKDRHFGLLYLDNSTSKGIFRDSDLALATIISDLAAASLEKSYYHHRALQAERVAAARSMVSSLSRELLPALRTIDQVAQGLGSGSERELLQQKATQAKELLEQLVPLGASSRRVLARVKVESVLEKVRESCPSGVELPVPPPDGWPALRANEEKLVEVLCGMIEVASSSGATVRCQVAREPRVLRFVVTNSALKKSVKEWARAFLPRLGGGLMSVQRIVHEHKGLLRAYPDPEGGAVLTAEFPLEG